ncbi:MAG: hypothetical protein ABIB97_05950 [Patescibacteria group bacterium]
MFQTNLTIAGRSVVAEIHDDPHLDEAAVVWLFTDFPMKPADLTDLMAAYDDGAITIGFGGGPLDEHPQSGEARRNGVCAATLAADFIGDPVIDDQAAMDVVDFVCRRDTNVRTRDGSYYDLSSMMKEMNRRGLPPEQVVAWGIEGLRAAYNGRKAYWATAAEIKEKGTITTIPAPVGEADRQILVIVSDNPHVKDFAFNELNVAVVVQQQATGQLQGNVQIFTNHECQVDMDDVTTVLRYQEQMFHLDFQGRPPVTDWKVLRNDGMFPDPENPDHDELRGMPPWYYFRRGRMVLNGSETHPDLPATQIPLERIADTVAKCLDPTYFEESKCEDCLAGKCTAGRGNGERCRLYTWGLKRCRTLRYQQTKAAQGGDNN